MFTVINIAVLLLTSGCASYFSAPTKPFTGQTFNLTQFPVDLEFTGDAIGPKEGRASANSVLGLVAWGDAGVHRAAERSGIQRVDHVDAEFMNVLGIYSRYQTIVYGE